MPLNLEQQKIKKVKNKTKIQMIKFMTYMELLSIKVPHDTVDITLATVEALNLKIFGTNAMMNSSLR